MKREFRERNEILEFNKKFPDQNKTTPFEKLYVNLRIRTAPFFYRRYKAGTDKWLVKQEKLSHLASAGLGPKLRAIFYEETLTNCGKNMYIHSGVTFYFPYNISIGDNVYMNRNVFITARDRVEIGDNVLIGPNVMINTGNHVYTDPKTPIYLQGHVSEEIVIEDDVWIAANVAVLKGVRIGKGSVVGAGSVVVKDVPPYSVVVGVPAKKIKERA
ncbi:serine acetyltransferase [Candidatus Methanoplasma termitum]|uniref:DapH1 protein n=1 Tax=Candidatus Methanoplasma termitum TaxID=1577791 RepID=A0A0A7LBE7_9ARCH|nr:acyltransferase [Candidatus Methanoplasma termitum]AIZ56343.1 serine acetyltransferase [Candidatus Methanoplasma termitum]